MNQSDGTDNDGYEIPVPEHLYSVPRHSECTNALQPELHTPHATAARSSTRYEPERPILHTKVSPFREYVQRDALRAVSPRIGRLLHAYSVDGSPSSPTPRPGHIAHAASDAEATMRHYDLADSCCSSPRCSPITVSRNFGGFNRIPSPATRFHAESGDEIFVLDDRNFKPVMNRHGEVAFVPERIISPATQRKTPPRLKNASWLMASYFHGHISRQEAEAVLSNKRLEAGAFLLRLKDGEKHVFALSVKVSGSDLIEHHLLQVDERGRDPIQVNGKPLISCFTIEEAIEFMASNESRGPLLPHKLRIPVSPGDFVEV